jgi:hypothetical protein
MSLLPRQQEAKIVSFFGFQPTWKTSSLLCIIAKDQLKNSCTQTNIPPKFKRYIYIAEHFKPDENSYLWQSKVWSAISILRKSNNLTVLSVDPVATTHSLKGLKAKQLTWHNIMKNLNFHQLTKKERKQHILWTTAKDMS